MLQVPTRTNRIVGTRIEGVLARGEVLHSTGLIARIESRGFNRGHARQLLAREVAAGRIWQSNLEMPNRARLYALHGSIGNRTFLRGVRDVLVEHRPGLARCIDELAKHEGILRALAERLLAVPIGTRFNHRHPRYEQEVEALVDLGVARLESKGATLERLVRRDLLATPASIAVGFRLTSEAIIERRITRLLVDRLKQMGLISWGGESLPRENQTNAEFNDFPFCGVSYSFAGPAMRWDKKRQKYSPAPVLIETVPGVCRLAHVESFLQRRSRSTKGWFEPARVLGVIASTYFEKDAFTKAKQENLLTMNLSQMFGPAAVTAIEEIIALVRQTLRASDDVQDEIAESLVTSFENLRNNPIVADLRAMALESIAALTLRSNGWEDVSVGRSFAWRESSREVDVVGKRSDETYLIECKAGQRESELSPDDVTKFFTQTVPAALDALRPVWDPRICHAEIWTTGTIGARAAQVLSGLKLKPFVVPKLLSLRDVEEIIPKEIKRLKKLLNTIAEC